MRYNQGDIVKLDASRQNIINPFVLHCPYIEVNADWDSDSWAGTSLWGFCTLFNGDTGIMFNRTEYFFNHRGSVLYEAATPVVPVVGDVVMGQLSQWMSILREEGQYE